MWRLPTAFYPSRDPPSRPRPRNGTSIRHLRPVPDRVVTLTSGERPSTPAEVADVAATPAGDTCDAQLRTAIHDVVSGAGA